MNTIKCILFVCAIFANVLLLAGADKLKLAVVGAEDSADLLFAALSENDSFELLEREAVKQLAAERKLAALNWNELKKCFPHTDVFVVFRPRDIIFFDAKNGTLAGKFLRSPKDGAEALANMLAAKLGAYAAREKNANLLPPVSITGISNAAAPAEFKKQYELCADALEQQMVNDADTVCLERRSLGNVNAERELADAAFPLSPSARLIYLEFTQSGKAGTADCAVYLLKPDGTGVKKLYFANIFAGCEPEKKAAEMWRAIKENLTPGTASAPGKPEPRGTSGMKEARKIVASIRSDDPVSVKIEKYDAAIALHPKRRYRIERLELLEDTVRKDRSLSADERLARLEEIYKQKIELKIHIDQFDCPRIFNPTPRQAETVKRIYHMLRLAAINDGRAENKMLSRKKQITLYSHTLNRLNWFFISGMRSGMTCAEPSMEDYVLYLNALQEFIEEICTGIEWKSHGEIDDLTCRSVWLFGPLPMWRGDRSKIRAFIPQYEKSPNPLVRSVAARIKFVAKMDALKPEEATAERLTLELDAHEVEMRKMLMLKDRVKSLLDFEIQVLAQKEGGVFPDRIIEDALKKYRDQEKRTFSGY